MIKAQFSGERIFSNSSEAFSLHEKSRFGEKTEGGIEYMFVEAFYLVAEGKMQVFSGDKMIALDELTRKIRRIDKKIEIKSAVFKDLRRRGFIVKTALKFGAEFRVYDRGVKPGDEHARWILYAVRESEALRWHDFVAKNRIAHSTKKKLLLGVLDEEGDVTYYVCDWARL